MLTLQIPAEFATRRVPASRQGRRFLLIAETVVYNIEKMRSRIVILVLLFLVASCKTYTIPVDSFKKQMIGTSSENSTEVEINNPLLGNGWGNIKYYSNNVDGLYVIDKEGNKLYLDNSPSIEMRVTHRNGKKYHFYFDTVILENNILSGSRSRFISGLTRYIPMDSIVKIEVQDGGKKFKYQN